MNNLYKNINSLLNKNRNEYKENFSIKYFKLFENIKCTKSEKKKIKILILNPPCYGFGDLIFAHKLANYLRKWYDCNVFVATTLPNKLKMLGESEKYLLHLYSKGRTSCRRFKKLKLLDLEKRTVKKVFDLIAVAPIHYDSTSDYRDVKYLIPYSNYLNTIFFSEYNDSLQSFFHFHTGIGRKRYGLLLTDPIISKKKMIDGKYALVYIANAGSVSRPMSCFSNFAIMVCEKHQRESKFKIICPEWITNNYLSYKKRVEKYKKYFKKIVVKTRKKTINYINDDSKKSNTLIIDGSILPVNNQKMLNLMKYSVRDILVTGDQSLTDVLSCCGTKNVFYQIASHKENFARKLAELLPNKYLERKKTSCGGLKSLSYDSNYKQFIKDNDARIKLKKPLDNIVCSVIKSKKDERLKEFVEKMSKRGAIITESIKV